ETVEDVLVAVDREVRHDLAAPHLRRKAEDLDPVAAVRLEHGVDVDTVPVAFDARLVTGGHPPVPRLRPPSDSPDDAPDPRDDRRGKEFRDPSGAAIRQRRQVSSNSRHCSVTAGLRAVRTWGATGAFAVRRGGPSTRNATEPDVPCAGARAPDV